MSNNECSPPHAHNRAVDNLSSKFDKISGKAVAIGVSVLIGLFSMLYTDMKTKVDTLDTRVSYLYQDKVSRDEFANTLRDFKNDMLVSKRETNDKIDSLRKDIIDRMNILIEYNSKNKYHPQ